MGNLDRLNTGHKLVKIGEATISCSYDVWVFLQTNSWIVEHFARQQPLNSNILRSLLPYFTHGRLPFASILVDFIRNTDDEQGISSWQRNAIKSALPPEAIGENVYSWSDNGGFASLSEDEQIILRITMSGK